jgi:2-haloacid dehalogenase
MESSQAPDRVRPEVVLLDVNETLSDLRPMAARFEEVGAPGHQARLWFTEVLRDGFALAAGGSGAAFADVAAEVLRTTLDESRLDRGLEDAVEHVLSGLGRLSVHPDVPAGLRGLDALGVRLVTLSNGATSVADDLLERAGVRPLLGRLLSVEDAGAWKPAARAYRYALDQCGVPAGRTMLVAVHPWDVDGASRAGLRTAWVNRSGGRYPAHFRAPDVEVESLDGLAERLR